MRASYDGNRNRQIRRPRRCFADVTITAALRTLTAALTAAYAPAEARALARRVVAHRLRLAPHELALRAADPLPDTPAALIWLADDQRRLLAHEPVQYILGTAPFLALDLEVGPGVLIPRPETEELAQLLLAALRGAASPRILDVGTGSGCLAVALAHYLPRADVTGLDVSPEALAIARRNGARYGERVRWWRADIFGELPAAAPFDVIVSNPPYVPQREAAEMAPHVRDHEPALALFVPDDDPLKYYRRLAEVGAEHLRPGGRLYLETHTAYAGAVKALLTEAGYAAVRVIDDFTGRPRFVEAKYSS